MSGRVLNLHALRLQHDVEIGTDHDATRYALPPDVTRVDRGTPWGNPMKIGAWRAGIPRPLTRDDVVVLYRLYAIDRLVDAPAWIDPLIGRRLACWCAPLACHADVLLELVDVVVLARQVMHEGDVSAWLGTPAPILSGLAPRDVIAAQGAREVIDNLAAIAEGVFQ